MSTKESSRGRIDNFKKHVMGLAVNPDFVHHQWFVEWHLKIVERLALELIEPYPAADRDLVEVMVWLHDYGKILDYEHQYDRHLLDAGRDTLLELGFDQAFATKAADYIELLDKKLTTDLRQAPIEVQIVSTADGCSHMTGPFLYTIWHEATDTSFAGKTMAQLMHINRQKLDKDWQHKIVLPEARQAFEVRYRLLCEQAGDLPEHFLVT